MADVAGKASGAPGAVGSAPGAVGGITSSASGLLGGLKSKAMGVVDSILPPQKRQEWKDWLVGFAMSNPKLSAFLLTNVALTGIPLGLFILFTITVTVFSLLAALIIALLVAVLFIVFCVGVALIFVLPTVFFTTMAATFFFLWGMGGYYIFKWFNETSPSSGSGGTIGDQLNSFTGGRMSRLMDGARETEDAKTSIARDMPHLNGSAKSHASSKSDGGHGEKEHAPPKLKDQRTGEKTHKTSGGDSTKKGDGE